MIPPVAITRVDVAIYVQTLIYLYIALIFVRVLASFAPRIPYNPVLRGFLDYVESVTEPYLRLWRAILPSIRMGPTAIDLTPMVGTIALIMVGLYVIPRLIVGG